MADIAAICRSITNLNDKQIDILHTLGIVCQASSDLCQGQITVYTRARSVGRFAIVRQVMPNTIFYQHRSNAQGETVAVIEEPLIWHVITHGESMCGQRESRILGFWCLLLASESKSAKCRRYLECGEIGGICA